MLVTLWAADGAEKRFAPSLSPTSYPVGPRSAVVRTAAASARAGADEILCVTSDTDNLSEVLPSEFDGTPVTVVTPDESITSLPDVTDNVIAALDGATVYDADGLSRLFDRAPATTVPADNGTVEGRLTPTPESIGHARPSGDGPDLLDGATVTDLVRWVREPVDATAVRLPVHLDVRRPWELLAANERALADVEPEITGEVAENAQLNGPVHVEADAQVRSGAVIEGPAVVCAGATVGPNAYVRGATLVGSGAFVGHGVEVKNSVLFAGARVPHLSYVGDSVVGPDANFGAGSIVANVRHDSSPVRVSHDGDRVSTGRRKFGAVVGEGARLGIGTRLNVGVTVEADAATEPGETLLRDRRKR